MLTKDLLRVSRRGGGYRPRFAGSEDRALAGSVLGVYQGHVGEERATLTAALEDLEREAADFKLVRGVAKLLEREAAFETRAAVEPRRARRAAFDAAEAVGVVTEAERERALERAADDLGLSPPGVADALHADREDQQVLAAFDPRWGPEGLVAQYNLSLAQTALFDATELRLWSSEPRRVVTAIKRLGLLYEIRKEPAPGSAPHTEPEGDGAARGSSGHDDTSGDAAPRKHRVFHLTGPDALFRRTRRYGTRFARLLRAVAQTPEWNLAATIDDRGTERELALSHEAPVRVPDAEPVAEVTYDSGVEREFAARFDGLDLDWELTREPAALDAGKRVMIPDFAFDYAHAPFRVFFEIMGFWTPEYVEKKLAQVDAVEGAELVVAVDESLGAGEALEARDARAITYTGSVPVKPVRDALRRYEDDLVADAAADLPDALAPDDDTISLATLAERHGVSEAALDDKRFPDHELVGRTLVRPAVLDAVADELRVGMEYDEAEAVLDDHDLDDASAVLARLGYRVAWEGLGGGTLREREDE